MVITTYILLRQERLFYSTSHECHIYLYPICYWLILLIFLGVILLTLRRSITPNFNEAWDVPVIKSITGGHRTRVAAVTLDNMAEYAIAALASLRQIITVSVRYCGPAFVSWLSMLWDTLPRFPQLQWFGISPQFRLKVSRGDEDVGHVCFLGDEGVGRPWLGYHCVQLNVGPA